MFARSILLKAGQRLEKQKPKTPQMLFSALFPQLSPKEDHTALQIELVQPLAHQAEIAEPVDILSLPPSARLTEASSAPPLSWTPR